MDKTEEYERFRVAIASSDGGYTVDTHFGRATEFYVYQFFDGEWIFIEKRSVTPVCQGGKHSAEGMERIVDFFTDCKYAVASRIGAGANSALSQKGIITMALPGDVIEALNKIYTYNEIQNLF